VLELLKVLLSAGLLGVCLMKMIGRPGGVWEGVMDWGVAIVAVSSDSRTREVQTRADGGMRGQIYIAVASFASLVRTEWAKVVRRQQIVLFGALVLVLGLQDVSSFRSLTSRYLAK